MKTPLIERSKVGFSLIALLCTCLGLTAAPDPRSESPYPPVPDLTASPFLLEKTEARAVVVGPVAHVSVTQTWSNPNSGPVDGLYIFPLPENAAVTDMKLRIGERTIRGEMRRREEARAIYERARQEGRVAGLLDQERPNIFAQRVANIMPGKRVEVVLDFDHEIKCEAGACEYVFPTVVGPRFIPARQTDPGLIDPPVVEEGKLTRQRLSLAVEVEAGIPIHDLTSPSHRVVIARPDETRARVTLTEGEGALLNRDFRLSWRVGGEVPELGLLAWRDPKETREPGVFTLVLQPPSNPDDGEATPRELVFVLDCSGSMRGVPLEAAKKVVRQSLSAVRPEDTFQILRFSEQTSGLAPRPLTPTPENLRRALGYLESLQGQGGTEMLSGIRAALGYPPDAKRLRIVAFLTDGYIGNEREIFAEVRRSIGNSRLFAFGIGSSVNRYLLEGLAEEGRGTAAFLGPRESPDDLVKRFIERIDHPVLTDIRITWEDLEVEDLEPARIPDLFAGQALLVHGRYRKPGTGLVQVEGRSQGRWETFRKVAIFLEQEEDHEALARLWARARIHRLRRELHEGHREDVKEAIVALGLRHRLMTEWTSLVAVDTVVSNLSGPGQQLTVPVEMPEDVSYEGVFGNDKRKGHGSLQQLGYVGSSSAPVAGVSGRLVAEEASETDALRVYKSQDAAGGERRADGSPKPADPEKEALPTFQRVTLMEADGTQIVVEADGEIWRIQGRRRTLLGAMATSELGEFRSLLAAVSPRNGSAVAVSGRRLILEGPWGRTAIPLSRADAAIRQIVEFIERRAS